VPVSDAAEPQQGDRSTPSHAGAKRVHSVNPTFITDERIADALMNYASALAIVDVADVVRIPGVGEDGKLQAYELVIGPSSQLMSVTVDDIRLPEHIPVDEVVADLVDRSEKRLPSTVEIDRDVWGAAFD
jgi:hypothetical protein